MKKLLYTIPLAGLLLAGCGGSKKLATEGGVDTSLSAKKVIALHRDSHFDFETLACRVGVQYEEGRSSKSITVSLRMAKDEAIWASASFLGMTLAKLYVTPERVQYYETLGKTYFDGDYTLLSDWLGVEVDFDIAQNLLLGQAIFDLDAQAMNVSPFHGSYRLEPKKQPDWYQFLLLLNPGHHKVGSQQVLQAAENRRLSIDYPNYQNVAGQTFPKEIRITANDGDSQMRIRLDYRNVDYNADVSFPFSIPKGYEAVE